MKRMIKYITDPFEVHTPPAQAYFAMFVVLTGGLIFLIILRELVFLLVEAITS